MLFLTNFLAILLAGGITFMLGGLGRMAMTDEHQRTRRNAFVVIAIATLLVAIPLGITTYQTVDQSLENRAAIEDVNVWLTGTYHQMVAVNVSEKNVVTTVDGSGELRPLRELANTLAQTLGRPVIVNLRVVPSQLESSGGGAQ